MSLFRIGMPPRKKQWVRRQLGSRHGWACHYCKRKGDEQSLTLDHLVPRSRGGDDTLANLVLACEKCNLDKAALTAAEYQTINAGGAISKSGGREAPDQPGTMAPGAAGTCTINGVRRGK